MRTTYIIGAGASCEAGLPATEDLKSKISDDLDIRFEIGNKQSRGNINITRALRELAGTEHNIFNLFQKKAWHIRDALPLAISIDNFIDAHRDDEEVTILGKLAILNAILEAERNSKLFVNEHRGYLQEFATTVENTWYSSFFKLLTENCTAEELPERLSQISLIIFNYDRCFEQFMFYALRNYYRLDTEIIADLINDMKIYHPYGSVGPLKWQNNNDGDVSFGQSVDSRLLLENYESIRTFTEELDRSNSDIKAIKQSVEEAQRLVFLGFGFHQINMKVVKPEAENEHPMRAYATTYRISERDQENIQKQIASIYRGRIFKDAIVLDKTCSNFFKSLRHSLSF